MLLLHMPFKLAFQVITTKAEFTPEIVLPCVYRCVIFQAVRGTKSFVASIAPVSICITAVGSRLLHNLRDLFGHRG